MSPPPRAQPWIFSLRMDLAVFGGSLLAGLAALLLALGYSEEWLWDLGIWHDHPGLFGQGWDLGPRVQALLVPLLALPQAVHYALDGFIWRRGKRSSGGT